MKKRGLMGFSSVIGGIGLFLVIAAWSVDMSAPMGWWMLVAGLVGLIVGTLFMKD